jgi:hypothetical protein
MSNELTTDEKISIVDQHLKNLQYTRYNLELSVKEANAAAVPNTATIDSLTLQMSDIDAQSAVINTELTTLNAAKAAEQAALASNNK